MYQLGGEGSLMTLHGYQLWCCMREAGSCKAMQQWITNSIVNAAQLLLREDATVDTRTWMVFRALSVARNLQSYSRGSAFKLYLSTQPLDHMMSNKAEYCMHMHPSVKRAFGSSSLLSWKWAPPYYCSRSNLTMMPGSYPDHLSKEPVKKRRLHTPNFVLFLISYFHCGV